MSTPILIPTTRSSTAISDSDTSTLCLSEFESGLEKTKPIACPAQLFAYTDSGYGTGNNTTFASPSDKAKTRSGQDDDLQAPVRSVPLPGKEELRIFRTDMGNACNARFREIAPEMQRQLLRCLSKGAPFFSSTKTRSKIATAVSIRLMMVGGTLETAKPSIVIFLPGEKAKHLESVIKQPALRQLYDSDDGITPSFNVIVVSEAPKKRFCQDVQIIWDTNLSGETDSPTYCGVQLCLQTPHGSTAMATLGGIVKLTYGPGDVKLVGMTAGHVLEELLYASFNDVESEAGLPILGTMNGGTRRRDKQAPFANPKAVGTVLHPRVDNELRSEDLDKLLPARDWAIFEIHPTLKIKPNLPHIVDAAATHRRRTGSMGALNGRRMAAAPPESFPAIEPIEVALLAGSSHFGGTMLGTLSHIPGGIMLSPGKGFVDAYLLTLDEGQEVQDGDSGSWVINPISMEAYGHIVATDMTGDAYIIPLHQSLDEMRQVLGLESVDLPRTADLLDAALQTSAEGSGASGSGKLTMAMQELREKRTSEVLILCEGLQMRDSKRFSNYDGDSGYGSISSNMGEKLLDVAGEDEISLGSIR